ncbi:BRCA1-associated protein-like [Iris pallida]|uniref:BRCA1-associated protein-like n=1 Tax=Iris pallida TaxID=29817 RepID=A0AAX6DWB2_IRIPA|nr:BRCA1-associated protein-like [Iris pallida]
MFCLRIHSLDSPVRPHPPQSSSEPQETSTSSSSSGFIKESFGIESIRGIIHLYRTAGPPPSLHPFPDSLLPAGRGTCLFVLAVPTRLSADDFLRFCGSYADRASGIRIVRNDALEDRYSVLVKFDDQENADAYYLNLNGWRFSSAEGEVCHILFLGSVEYTDLMEIADTPPVGSTELPTCPVCLERLDQDTSGIVAATCDHSFQCACISKWASSSCSVCQLCQKHSQKSACSVCGTSENLWICLICGFVGCGRYKEGHAFRHWKDTQHCYSLDLELQRVWDYVGDTYVHRLNQSKGDDKLGKLRSSSRYAGDNCESFECGDQSGISGTLLSSKVEAIVDEYNRLLASQLESQRQYYENLLEEEKEKREKHISESVEKAVTLKMQDIQLEIDSVVKEKKVVADINENLVKNQNLWREKIKELEDRERETLRSKNEKIRDLEEEIRDFTVFIGAQKVLDDMGDTGEIQGGTLLPVPAPPPSSRTNRSSKGNRRRK